MLREDRSTIIERIDHTDSELEQYRKDIRELHDQISKSVFDKIREAHARALANAHPLR